MTDLKIAQIGNSLGVILPRELLARLRWAKGDSLFVTEAPDGIRLTIANPDFEAQMKVAREVMRRRRQALRELAK